MNLSETTVTVPRRLPSRHPKVARFRPSVFTTAEAKNGIAIGTQNGGTSMVFNNPVPAPSAESYPFKQDDFYFELYEKIMLPGQNVTLYPARNRNLSLQLWSRLGKKVFKYEVDVALVGCKISSDDPEHRWSGATMNFTALNGGTTKIGAMTYVGKDDLLFYGKSKGFPDLQFDCPSSNSGEMFVRLVLTDTEAEPFVYSYHWSMASP